MSSTPTQPPIDAEEHATKIYDARLLRRLWHYVRPHRRMLLLALLMLPLASGLHLVQPYLVKLAIDKAIVPGALDRLAPIAAALVVTLILESLARYAEALLLQLCGERSTNDLRIATHRHLLSLGTSYFDRTPVGKLMTRVTSDIESMTEAFGQGLIALLGDFLLLGGIVVVMLAWNFKLAVLTLTTLPLLWLLNAVYRRLIRRVQRLIRRRIAEINAFTQEHITGMSIVQLFGRQQRTLQEFDQVNRAHRDAFQAAIRYDASLYALVELISSVTVALLLWYGGLRVLHGSVSFGLLVAFIEYVQRFFGPVRDISAQYMTMQQAMAAAERVFELLDRPEEGDPLEKEGDALATPPRPPRSTAAVEFRGVTFGYLPGQPVLRDVSFTVQRGESAAIVGATGSGKSTVVRLLSRLYSTAAGSIHLGDEDVRHLRLEHLRRRVVVVSQDTYLFSGTVGDNIALGDSSIAHEQIVEAAQRVGLSRVLTLEHLVQERGANLSAGERQLVAFARALVRDPEVLVLDEATANVDPESEKLVQEGIAELMRERTAIVIAHRLSTIERANRILVLHRGQLVEQGSHAELLAARGIYSHLYQLQYVAEE